MFKKLYIGICFALVLGVYFTSAAQADLVGWWRLDEGSGNIAYDSSGNGRDGTLNGDPQWVTGFLGGALDFDGDDYVDTGYTENLANWTIAAWVKSPAAPSSDSPSGPLHREQNYQFNWNHSDATFRGAAALNVGGTWYAAKYEPLEADTWYHLAATYDGENFIAYRDGVMITNNSAPSGSPNSESNTLKLGRHAAAAQFFTGTVDDARVYNEALTESDIKSIMFGTGIAKAISPDPEDGAIHKDTWVTLSWRPGDFAVSHNVYMGENFDDVNNGTGDTFRDNLPLGTDFYIAGFFGYPYPDGLVNGTTYYWRIDEVNETEPNSPWKGDVWSFTVPPKTAYFPNPADNAEFVDLGVTLSWTAGSGAKLHFIVFGEDFDEVQNAATGTPNGTTTYRPGPLQLAKTYYWRVDESDGIETHKGDVWSFTTVGAVSGPNPTDGAVDVKPSVALSWIAGAVAESHDVYFGMDTDTVKNATTASPEYKGPKALGEESYDPGKLTLNTTYYWRIDEVNSTNADSPWEGNVWSFTTGDYFVIDDFEDYNADDNEIWYAWHDGLGAGAPGVPGYVPGNGTGSAVGDETTASYTEETIVHGGNQSMPIAFDNNQQGFDKYSEVELTLTNQRDWTEEGMANLSLWFRGNPPSVGSFVEGPTGTYTMTGSGADIWDVGPAAGQYHDEFHFAYKMLTGTGSIVAKVESVTETNAWAKAGVMIRETLNGNSKHAMMVVSAASGVSFQRRPETGGASAADTTADLAAPYWVKLERDLSGNFSAYSSADGVSWQKVGLSEPLQMATNVYIGLVVTAHNAAATCEAVFSNVTTTGNVTGQWANQDVGIESNDAEPLYVAVSNSTGAPAVIVNDDPSAAQIDTWTQWIIPLQAIADQGIILTNVDKIAIGLGTQGNTTVPGGKGKMYIDDIRLLQPVPEPEPQP
jgi:hypothetical protein